MGMQRAWWEAAGRRLFIPRHIWSPPLSLVHSILPCACLTMVTRAMIYGKRRARGTNVGIMQRRLWAAMRTHSDRMNQYTVIEDPV
jgi:hypothetical protein